MATISTALRNVMCDAAVDLYDGGVLEIRSGAAPGPNAADGGTLLVSITLPTPAFGAAATGVAAKAGTWQDTSADATGTAGHFRIKQSGDTGGATGATDERIEGTVSTSGADLNLDSVSITAGQTVTVDTFTVTMPAT